MNRMPRSRARGRANVAALSGQLLPGWQPGVCRSILALALLWLVALLLCCAPKAEPARQAIIEAHAGLPIGFEVNQGQAGPSAKFISRGRGYSVLLTPSETVLVFRQSAGTTALVMKLAGANSSPGISGLEELPGRTNYFLGNDPRGWRTNIPRYAKVRYQQVYAGVDLIYYGKQSQLECDFVIAPGADPAAIRLRFEGANGIKIDARGDLMIPFSTGSMIERRPTVYQEFRGLRREIAGRYVLRGDTEVGFEVGPYDRAKPLVIDPVLVYATLLGGSGDYREDEGRAIAVDAAGNAYVAGWTTTSKFPTTPGAYRSTPPGEDDVFVAKFDPSGARLIYCTYLGGKATDLAKGIAVDSEGNVYVAGVTNSDNFPTTRGAFQTGFGGGTIFADVHYNDAFLTKLDSSGSRLIYSTYLGGNNEDQAWSLALDPQGNAYVAGDTASGNFPTTNAFQRNLSGSQDAFVAKFGSGGAVVYCTFFGGEGPDFARAAAADAQGKAYVVGGARSYRFPVLNALQPANAGARDAWVAEFGPAGSLIFSTHLGGTSEDTAGFIAVDSAGNMYIAGVTEGPNFPTTPGALQTSYRGGSPLLPHDAWVAKLHPSGTRLIYSMYLGGSGGDYLTSFALDPFGEALLGGYTYSPDFPAPDDVFRRLGCGSPIGRYSLRDCGFILKLNAAGSALISAMNFLATAIAWRGFGDLYLTGQGGAEFQTTVGAYQTTLAGGKCGAPGEPPFPCPNAFVARMRFPFVTSPGVVNAASFQSGPVAPGEIISLFGSLLGPANGATAQLDAGGRVAVSLADTKVLFDGVPGPLFFVQQNQINVQVPYTVAGKEIARLQIVFGSEGTNEVELPVAASAPGIFVVQGGSNQAVVVNQDGSLNSPANPARAGDVVVLYATGEGQTSPPGETGKLCSAPLPRPALSLSLKIGGVDAPVLFAGCAPGFAGLLQINARVPDARGDRVPLELVIGESASQPGVTMAVR